VRNWHVGCNDEDVEAREAFAAGLVVREPITAPSSWRSTGHLQAWLEANGFTGISGIDTRRLTRHLRQHGAQNGVIAFSKDVESLDIAALQQKAKDHHSLKGTDLASEVTIDKPYAWTQGRWRLPSSSGDAQHRTGDLAQQGNDPRSSLRSAKDDALFHVVAVDYGAKLNILRCLADVGCRVTVVPGTTNAEDILAYKPNGIFLANGPADAAATGQYAIPELRSSLIPASVVWHLLGHRCWRWRWRERTDASRTRAIISDD
jgi:Carbamoylphosphate synthase small subunit